MITVRAGIVKEPTVFLSINFLVAIQNYLKNKIFN